MQSEYPSRKLWFIIGFLSSVFVLAKSQDQNFGIFFSETDLSILVSETKAVDLKLKGVLDHNVTVTLLKQHQNLININPEIIFVQKANSFPNQNVGTFNVTGLSPGHLEVIAVIIPNKTTTENNFLRVTIGHSSIITYISNVCGWLYFAAWSISFYPQIFINFRRKSVIGLNFDFLSLNVMGFILYTIFNIGLFWIPEIEDEYFKRHPRGLNPVLLNDVFFSVHASLATIITLSQCFFYERGEQTVSRIAKALLSFFAIVLIVCVILSATYVLHWLDFFYICSYIKLTITLIKYIPQAVMNYKRKSTVGWSIGNVLLDFTGGILSILQMILNAYNHDDWVSIFGDPTKFGLGLFSVCFDILFILQHYVFYRGAIESQHNVLIANPVEVTDQRINQESS